MKHPTMTRLLCAILTLCLLCGGLARVVALVAVSFAHVEYLF